MRNMFTKINNNKGTGLVAGWVARVAALRFLLENCIIIELKVDASTNNSSMAGSKSNHQQDGSAC